jgi:hypothetical protein
MQQDVVTVGVDLAKNVFQVEPVAKFTHNLPKALFVLRKHEISLATSSRKFGLLHRETAIPPRQIPTSAWAIFDSALETLTYVATLSQNSINP